MSQTFTDSVIISIFEEENEERRLDLLIIYAHDIKYEKPNQSIHLFKYSYEIAKKLNLTNREIFCAYHIAETYYRVPDLHNALKYYKIYGSLAKELNDTLQIADSYYLMAYIYYEIGNYIDCEKHYIEAIKNYSLINNYIRVGNCYNNLGLIYDKEDLDKALFYYKKAYDTNKQEKNDGDCSINMNNIACIYLYKGQAEKSKEILDSALNIAIEEKDLQAQFLINESMGEYFQLKKDYINAEKSYLHSLELYNSYKYIVGILDLLELLYTFYEEINNFKLAYNYYKIYITKKDSLFKLTDPKTYLLQEHKEKIKEVKLKNQVELKNQKEKENKYKKMIIYISLFFISIIVIYTIKRKQEKKRKKLLLENQELRDKLLLEKLENKNKELVSKTLLLGERNNLIKDVSEKLISCKSNLKKTNLDIIQSIINDLNSNLNKKQWEDFHTNFQNLYPDFYSNLLEKYPDLSPNELKLCSFIKLNMSSKEIAQITYVATNSVEVARSRIRKKLGLSNSSSNLQTFLTKF